MTTLYLDLETYCDRPIQHGTHAYAEQAEIIIAAWALGDMPVEVEDITANGSSQLSYILGFAAEDIDRVVIHNSAFDRTVLRHAWRINLPVEKIDDTMVIAMQHSLPGGLEKLCDIFNIPVDQAKSKEGKRLIQLFCKPRPKRQKIRRATRETHPEEWAKFIEYARLDIEAMRAVYKKLPRWNSELPTERRLWELDQKINDRGVAVDTELAEAAVRAVERERGVLTERAQELTAGEVSSATKRDELLRFILAAHDMVLPDLRASTIEKLLKDATDLSDDLRELLTVRLRASTASVAKYKALLRSVSSDGRLRGMLQFCGAGRTGRWAGRLMQLQNLPRPAIADLRDEALAAAIELAIIAMKADALDLTGLPVMEAASAAIRGTIVAAIRMLLAVADLSNIEGRMLAWLAGETWKLKAFADYDRGKGSDLYKVTAGRMLGKPPEEITKLERQEIGKVTELAMGYEGGVGAFITFATAFGIDLDDLARRARPNLSSSVLGEASAIWDWTKKKRRTTYGLEKETWIVIEAIKRTWRQAHEATQQLWKDLDKAARRAIDTGGKTFTAGPHLRVRRDGAWLRIILPSGRSLCYPSPKISDKGEITYMGVHQYTRKWTRIKTYGGKLVENVTQAAARDVLAEGMLLAEEHGFRVVLSVHDELLTEVPVGSNLNDEVLAEIMATNPSWATGLPLAAAGFTSDRYKKEG